MLMMNLGVVGLILLMFSNESIKYKNSLDLHEDCCKDANEIVQSQSEPYRVYFVGNDDVSLEISESMLSVLTNGPVHKNS